MIDAAGWPPRPGIVRISPQIGYTKPAPTDALTSRTLERVTGRRALQRRVAGDRQVGLGDAHRQVAEPVVARTLASWRLATGEYSTRSAP